jgi:regulator of protease activity HflC (stomatin/prohibitin superfamily)
MQDPSIQIAQEAERTKRMEVERKAKKDEADIKLRMDEQERKRASDLVNSELKLEEVAQDRLATSLEAKRSDIELQNERTELDRRTSLEVLKTLLGQQQPPKGSE